MTSNQISMLDAFVKVSSVLIAVFGVLQYFHQISLASERVAKGRSLSLVEEFGSDSIASSRMSISSFWIEHQGYVHHMNSFGASEKEQKRYLMYALENYDDKRSFVESVLKLTTFYDRLGYCVSSMSCDYKIVCEYFFKRAEEFYSSHHLFLEEFKEIGPYLDVGDGPERVMELCRRKNSPLLHFQ